MLTEKRKYKIDNTHILIWESGLGFMDASSKENN